jgi:diguanylate cyclase (GGDEF)-like protein
MLRKRPDETILSSEPSSEPSNQHQRPSLRKVSLPYLLVVPFIAQVALVAGAVGYLSYHNGQRAVDDLTHQLLDAVCKRVEQKLTSFLSTPLLVNQLNSEALLRADLDLNLGTPNAKRDLYLWQQMRLFKNLTWINLGTEQGDTEGIWRPGDDDRLQISSANRSTQYYGNYRAVNDQGQQTTLLKVEKPAYDPRPRPWYKQAVAAKKAIWTSIYPGFTPGTVFLAASQPLYDRAGKLVGVSGADILLVDIQTFLARNPVSPSGVTFLIERSGLLVASSSQEAPFRLVQGKDPQRVHVLDSQTPLIRQTARFLSRQLGSFETMQQQHAISFQLNHEAQLVEIRPFSEGAGLDWLIVSVVPESDVMAQIYAGTRVTIGLSILSVLGVIALNTWISRRLLKPIHRLSRASQQIAQGDLTVQVGGSRIAELSILSNSFNRMGRELNQSRQQLEDYSRSLEQKVADRTQALQSEIKSRIEAEDALRAANHQLEGLAYVDGLTQIANRRYFDKCINQEWGRLKREQLPLTVLLCDVDYFKQYNDSYGHLVGDDCLRDIAQAIAQSIQQHPTHLAARYGGEEFIMLLPSIDTFEAEQIAGILQERIQSLQLPHPNSPVSSFVTASFGIATMIPSETGSIKSLLTKADQALYQAKHQGRDRVAVAS